LYECLEDCRSNGEKHDLVRGRHYEANLVVLQFWQLRNLASFFYEITVLTHTLTECDRAKLFYIDVSIYCLRSSANYHQLACMPSAEHANEHDQLTITSADAARGLDTTFYSRRSICNQITGDTNAIDLTADSDPLPVSANNIVDFHNTHQVHPIQSTLSKRASTHILS
jgi:hypothetical protein